MPPVTKAGGDAFRKEVDFVTKDDDEQVAAGVVMVPDKADLQHDFAREETIRGFADQFAAFVEAGEAGGGIMHAAWPDDWMHLERNEVLDESETIGGTEVSAGAWVQEWQFDDDGAWGLVEDGILEGYSIGAIQVEWNGPYVVGEDDAVDDVGVPDAFPDDAMVWELTDGIVREVSAVDVPAVPDAQILETKAEAMKRLGDYLGDRDGFVDEAMERGHSEAEAERLWDELNRAIETDGAGEPGTKSMFARAGKAFLDAMFGADDGGASVAETSDTDPRKDAGVDKEGRTLSQANRDSVMATVDAGLDILHDAGMDEVPKRFTDREDVDFDLTEHDAREWGGGHGGGGGEDEDDPEDDDDDVDNAATTDNDPGGDTPDPNTTDMSDDDPDGEDKSLAEQNAEQINELTQAVENLTETIAGPEAKTAEIQIDGETYEVREDAAKAALGVGDDVGVEEAIERLNEKASRVDAVEERLDTISQQSGVSTQLEASRGSEGGEDDTGLDDLGKALS
jgi:hypothetical protein